MNTTQALEYYPLPWRLGEIEESSGGQLTYIVAANGEKVAIWLDPGAAQVIVDAVNRCAAEAAAAPEKKKAAR